MTFQVNSVRERSILAVRLAGSKVKFGLLREPIRMLVFFLIHLGPVQLYNKFKSALRNVWSQGVTLCARYILEFNKSLNSRRFFHPPLNDCGEIVWLDER